MDEVFFSKKYKILDQIQKEAVDSIEGPVMVVAGPGTGKTMVLTLRIANILRKTDTRPENILALTFTESGVYQMRRNLIQVIGSLAYRVHIATFHGFCNDIIRNNPEEFPDIIGSANATSVDQIKILETIIDRMKLRILKPYGNRFYYLYASLKKIGELKKDAISPKEFRALIKKEVAEIKKKEKGKSGKINKVVIHAQKKDVEKSKELLLIYIEYEREMKERGLYDYEDMIVEVIRIFEKNKDFLLEIEEQYHYILADEHQDANRAQNKILELLSSFHAPNPNLFIVGDEKQAIFRFQGASLDNFIYLKKLYPGATLINLSKNYRSHQKILDAAHSLIEKSPTPPIVKRVRLDSVAGKSGKPLSFYAFSKQGYETRFVIKKIKELLKEGVSPGEIAVLYRDNRDAYPFIGMCEREGISYTVLSDQNVLDDVDIRKLLTLFKTVYYFGDDEFLVTLFHVDFFGFDPLDVYKFISSARGQRLNFYELLASESKMRRCGIKEVKKFSKLYALLKKLKKRDQNDIFLKFFENAVQESGFLEYVLKSQSASLKVEKLNGLYDEVSSLVSDRPAYTLRDFVEYLSLVERYNLLVRKREVVYRDAVHFLTAHRAKGQEFSHVIIVNAYEGHWGKRRSRKLFSLSYVPRDPYDLIDDERRLFYVALTRAKEEVYITYSKEDYNGRERLPTQFIEEIDKKFIKEIKTKQIEEKLAKKDLVTDKKGPHKADREMKKYVNDLFFERGLSVTALNNYLGCPWKYFYMNLIRIPSTQTHAQLYGMAVHEALRVYFDKFREGEDIGKKGLIAHADALFRKLPMSDIDRERTAKRGRDALTGYHDVRNGTWLTNLITEFNVSGVLFLAKIKLSGRLDKVEFLDESGSVNVVDYKTGKPVSRRHIEGETKNSSGDYKRQLVFYKILLDLFDGGKYNMVSGELDFIEPDTKRKWPREVFRILDSEVEELKKVIQRVGEEIMGLSFWNRTCGKKDCRFCKLRMELD